MNILANILVGFVALEHLWVMYFEMFLWTKPYGLKFSRMTPEVAEGSKSLAANLGLYNGFLAIGLIFGLVYPNDAISGAFKLFFTGCVLIAGIYGGLTSNKRILKVQAFPAFLALVALIAAQLVK